MNHNINLLDYYFQPMSRSTINSTIGHDPTNLNQDIDDFIQEALDSPKPIAANVTDQSMSRQLQLASSFKLVEEFLSRITISLFLPWIETFKLYKRRGVLRSIIELMTNDVMLFSDTEIIQGILQYHNADEIINY